MKNQSFNCLMKLAWLMVSWCKHCVCKCQNNASVLIVCPDSPLAPSPPLPPLCLSLAHAEPGLQPALVPPCLASPARLVLLLHQGPWPIGRGEASQRVLVRDLSGRRPPPPPPQNPRPHQSRSDHQLLLFRLPVVQRPPTRPLIIVS